MPDDIGVGLVGYAFMGRAHASAYHGVRRLPAPPLHPRLTSICGRTASAVEAAARRYDVARATTDWHELVDDPDVQLVDICGPNDLHAEVAIAALTAGKHVLCEKPLGRSADEALAMLRAAELSGLQHMCAFNYRFVPAVRLAQQLIDAGELGQLHHFRASYLQDWGTTDDKLWRFDKDAAGSGALGDLGAHLIDLARYLAGEVLSVTAMTRTFRPGRAVDDAFAAVAELEGGTLATFEATRVASSNKNALRWELNGSDGSLAFDLERPNELLTAQGGGGFKRRLVTEPSDPFAEWWWPPGHVIGWEHSFVHEIEHLLGAIAGRNAVAPHGATFQDGYRAAEVCDAIQRSADSGRHEEVVYR